MPKIEILTEAVASQIAAGEVVERPASVVKELLENAIDAGATQITIRIEQAGRRLIELSDDGVGISPEQIQVAVSRHATSKLRTTEDLFHIATLGFRGEALSSIGSVSRMKITSRQPEEAASARVVVEGGAVRGVEFTGAPVGTVVSVEDLFYNVPARLKFLKRDLTERQQIDTLVTRYALAYPHIRFKLFHDGEATLQTSGNGDRREIFAAIYGVDVARQMLEISFTDENFMLEGFTSPVGLTRSNRKEITFFINGRWVQDTSLSAALLKGYHTLLMVGRYPLAVIFIRMDPADVDVNVHPAKTEVRFRQQDEVFGRVQRAIRRGLLAYSPPPQLTNLGWQSQLPPLPPQFFSRQIDPAWDMAVEAQESMAGVEPVVEGEAQKPQPRLDGFPAGDLPLLRLVGQVGSAYLVAEGPDGLYLIDQHAAHERVLFEKWQRQRGQPVPAQALLTPQVVQLPPQSSRMMNEQLQALEKVGFQIEPFGPNLFRVLAIPAIFSGADPAAVVMVAVEDFEEDETPLQTELEARLAARICKRAAVKAGSVLSTEEQKTLLQELEACKSPRTCPHGRPTMIHLSIDLLEKQFGRRGSR